MVKSIHTGSTPGITVEEYILNEKAIRLYKLSQSGVKLDEGSMEFVNDRSYVADNDSDDQNELHDIIPPHRKERIEQKDFKLQRLLNGTAADISTALLDSTISPDEFRGLARQQPDKAVSVLGRLAKNGEWLGKYWDRFLWSLYELRDSQTSQAKLMADVSQILKSAPHDFFTMDGSSIAGFVKMLADEWGIDREDEIRPLWEKTWSGIGSTRKKKDGPR